MKKFFVLAVLGLCFASGCTLEGLPQGTSSDDDGPVEDMPDLDHDGVEDRFDNCVAISNHDQSDFDLDNKGDVCDDDDDADGIIDAKDNCVLVPNVDQTDEDEDGIGDYCDFGNPLMGCPESISAQECGGGWAICNEQPLANIPRSSVIKTASSASIYWFDKNGKKWVFPNDKTYRTWYPVGEDCPMVYEVSLAEISAIPIAGNVTYRPGTRLVKITTDPKVYAVSHGGVLHWLQSETAAMNLFGPNWKALTDDVPDAFFVNYFMGTPITSSEQFDPIEEQLLSPDIDHDKNL